MARMTRTDSSIVRGTQSYTLTRTYKFDGDVVRTVVKVDFYQMQSYCVAEVLNADRKWTAVATEDGLDKNDFNVVSPSAAKSKSDDALWSSAAGDVSQNLKERLRSILG